MESCRNWNQSPILTTTQKCDRAQPCGLCKSRGVEHLCRWELEPFARPPPSRPNGVRKAEGKSPENKQNENPQQISERPGVSSSSSDMSFDSAELDIAVESEVKEAAIALAQLSVARYVCSQTFDSITPVTLDY